MKNVRLTHPTYKIMTSFLDEYLKDKKRVSLLDYGCGSGYLLELLPKRKIAKYTGYETSANAISTARKNYEKLKNVRFVKVDVQKPLRFNQSKVDIVIAIGVLQYMSQEQVANFIVQVSNILKKGGILLISTVTDHLAYRFFNLYGLFLPNRFLNKKKTVSGITKRGLIIEKVFEKGLFFGPLFYHNLVLAFDFVDKVLFRTKGTLGPFGKTSRKAAYFVAEAEYLLPFNVGYTMYIKAHKK